MCTNKCENCACQSKTVGSYLNEMVDLFNQNIKDQDILSLRFSGLPMCMDVAAAGLEAKVSDAALGIVSFTREGFTMAVNTNQVKFNYLPKTLTLEIVYEVAL